MELSEEPKTSSHTEQVRRILTYTDMSDGKHARLLNAADRVYTASLSCIKQDRVNVDEAANRCPADSQIVLSWSVCKRLKI